MIRDLKEQLNNDKNSESKFDKIEFLKSNYESPELLEEVVPFLTR